MPSVPKLATLAEVYGRPIAELIDLYELEHLRRLVPRKGTYDICRQLGIESLQKGKITKALACFLGALDSAKLSGAGSQQLASAYNNVGHALLKGGRYLAARRYLEEGLRIVENRRTHVRILDNLANVHYQLDNLPVADIFSREAAALAMEDEELLPYVRATRAAVLLDLKRYADAESLMRQALAEHRRAGGETDEIREMYNLGHCLVAQGRLDEGFDLPGRGPADPTQVPHAAREEPFFLWKVPLCRWPQGGRDRPPEVRSPNRQGRADAQRNLSLRLLPLAAGTGARVRHRGNRVRSHRTSVPRTTRTTFRGGSRVRLLAGAEAPEGQEPNA